jgi:hypothetical protein
MLAILSTSQLSDDSAVPPSIVDTAAATASASNSSARQLQLSAVSPGSCFKINKAQLVHATVGKVTVHTLHVFRAALSEKYSRCCGQCMAVSSAMWLYRALF